MKSRKKDEIDLFKEWVVSRGAEVLVATNAYEIARFRGHIEGVPNITHIIYVNAKGVMNFQNGALAAWTAFRARDPNFRMMKRTKVNRMNPKRRSTITKTLITRDGDACFYCGATFSAELPRTKEHLVAQTHGGPDHLSNVFLSCEPCNSEAGHLSAPEKIRLRDRKRRGRGATLLGRAYDRLFGGEGDPALEQDIQNFFHETLKPN